jgi:AraC family transcriptional regulator
MAAREPFDVFVDEKHIRRPRSGAGATAIFDLRRPMYSDLRDRGVDNLTIFIPTATLSQLAEDTRVPKIDRLESLFEIDHLDPVLFQIANILEPAISRPAEANSYFLEHIYAAVCWHVARRYGGLLTPSSLYRGSLTPLQEKRIIGRLLEELRDPPSLQALAASCGLSRSHFTRAFKESTGLPPHRWLLAERVRLSKELLSDSKMPIIEIALECGFADQSHFTRVFTKGVGSSPAAWRRMGRE